ncbi:efflux transporter outer membrane subunit [Azotobacter chroococcum]|uniref:Efflux transporter outer membrane subunit n=1 Tax=Azotobacter chroococcum TaxID=353 RepID=A0AA43Z628_9GAMM|nr:efflux transporter outer membrane subunit [Azotobacter chroococcum]
MRVFHPTGFAPHRLACSVTLALALTGCTLGPDYERPQLATPDSFKEGEGWKLATPADEAERGPWWEMYGDPVLDELMRRLDESNQTVAQSVAQYLQAKAAVRAAKADFFPTGRVTVDETRSATASGGGGTSRLPDGSTVSSGGGGGDISNSYNAVSNISWELDFWGKMRRQLESDRAGLQGSAADLAAVRLSQQSTLAQSYLQLRVLDGQRRLLRATVEAYARSLRLTENQYRAGMVTKADVTQALTQLKSTEAQAIDLDYQRAQLEHAIAVLTGVPPAEFELAELDSLPGLPEIPTLLPSQLLERRPDVAAAEREVISANALIGVAKAARFPTFSLSAAGGYRATHTDNWFEKDNRFWNISPEMALTLFDGGLLRSQVDQARATHQQAVATYRQTVLDSFREVEDYLVQLSVLERESRAQQEAVDAANESRRLMENQYKAGTVDYSSVVDVQTAALTNERTSLTLLSNRLTASVQLIAALGGGWDSAELDELEKLDERLEQAQAKQEGPEED